LQVSVELDNYNYKNLSCCSIPQLGPHVSCKLCNNLTIKKHFLLMNLSYTGLFKTYPIPPSKTVQLELCSYIWRENLSKSAFHHI